jgi:hypothetical protein
VSEIARKSVNRRADTSQALRQALRWHLHQLNPLGQAARDVDQLETQTL